MQLSGIDIPNLRLLNQKLSQTKFRRPIEVIGWLGAVQAQDYAGALWTIRQRLEGMNEAEIEEAVSKKTVVRTWPMRGTLHFVLAQDAKWMLKLLAPRIIRKMDSYYRKANLDQSVFNHSKKVLEKALKLGNAMTRPEIYKLFETEGIATQNTRGLFILGELAMEGHICFGAKKGKQQTFVLMNEWITNSKNIEGEEAIAELALRYFRSHGPATIHDFAWWSGLNLGEVRIGLDIAGDKLIRKEINKREYWLSPDIQTITENSKVYLLPAYDEFTIAYKDRSDLMDKKATKALDASNGFYSSIIVNGKVAGMWRRELKKDTVEIETKFVRKLSKAEQSELKKAADEYGKFLGMKVKISLL